MKTDTPRTDAAEPQLHSNLGGWVRADFARGLELELTHSLQNQMKSQSEVKSLTEKLASLQEAYLKSVERDNNLTQALFDSRAEVERLRTQLKRAVEIAEGFCGCGCGGDYGLCNFCSDQFSELDQIKATLYPTDK